MAEVAYSRRFVRFGSYEVDLPAGELKKSPLFDPAFERCVSPGTLLGDTPPP